MLECLLICAIGSDDSPQRKRADELGERVIQPVLIDHGYQLVRVDWFQTPGNISIQAIQAILTVPLVLADLTDANPNVFYELAIRHVAQKPVIFLIEPPQRIPFYLQNERTVQYGLSDNSAIKKAQKDLSGFIEEISKYKPTDPIITAIRAMDDSTQKAYFALRPALDPGSAEKSLTKKARFVFAEAGFNQSRGDILVWNQGDSATNVKVTTSDSDAHMRLHPQNAISSQDKDMRIVIEKNKHDLPTQMTFEVEYENSEDQIITEKYVLDWNKRPIVSRLRIPRRISSGEFDGPEDWEGMM